MMEHLSFSAHNYIMLEFSVYANFCRFTSVVHVLVHAVSNLDFGAHEFSNACCKSDIKIYVNPILSLWQSHVAARCDAGIDSISIPT